MTRSKIWMAMGCFIASTYSFALPVVSETKEVPIGDKIVLFKDHSIANKYYFFPDSAAFRKTSGNLPSFGFQYWSACPDLNIEAGGFMTFNLGLEIGRQQKNAMHRFASWNPGSMIAPLAVVNSTIHFASTRETESSAHPFFSRVELAPFGGQVDIPVAGNAYLTALGAARFYSAINTPQTFAFQYCAKLEGYGAGLDAQVTIHWEQIYSYFEMMFSSMGFKWIPAMDLAVHIERLRRNHAIEIVINGGDAQDQDYIREFTDMVLQKLFVFELEAKPGENPGTPTLSNIWSFSKIKLNVTDRRELHTVNFHMIKRPLVTREMCAPLPLADLAKYRNEIVQKVDACMLAPLIDF